jgi:hypothetical protein
VSDGYQVDHVFLATSKGGPEVEHLVAAGFAEGPPNTHAGQGTACRRIFFENGYLELIWLEDSEEASSPLVERTGLAFRAAGQEGASRIGICLRPREGSTQTLPVRTWPYRPPYLPAGMAIPMATSSSVHDEPLLFFVPSGAEGRGSQDPGHPNGARAFTRIGISLPGARSPSPELAWLAGSGCVHVEGGGAEAMSIELDHGAQGMRLDVSMPTPLHLSW